MQNAATPSRGQQSGLERRLATILMADVAGYSRMVGENEERTIEVLRRHRQIFDELLAQHRGRIFNTAGDAILAEFPSAVEAVRCATEIQTALRTRNEHLPEAERMWFRIGINLGDVIVQGGDLLGDGVNVAARIQGIAEPGGICISGSVYDQIQNKLTLQIRQLGEKTFKNIAQPIRTFSIADESGTLPLRLRWRGARKRPIAAAGIVVALIAVGTAGFWLYRGYALRVAEESRQAEEAHRAAELQRKAEQDRLAAEAVQREARLQGELRSAKEALQKAAESEKKAEQERQGASAALKAAQAAQPTATATAPAATAQARPATLKTPAPARESAAAAPDQLTAVRRAEPAGAAEVGDIERFNGAYAGRMCSLNADGSPRCWNVALSLQHGALSATWTNRFTNLPAHVKGTISPEGAVKIELDAYNARGMPMSGIATGNWSEKKITVSGTWSNHVPVDATWTWASADPAATVRAGENGDGHIGRGARRFR
jgi:class 3 adenylate cyclase